MASLTEATSQMAIAGPTTEFLNALEHNIPASFCDVFERCLAKGWPGGNARRFFIIDANRAAFKKVVLGVFAAVRASCFNGIPCNRISVLLMGRKGLGKSSLLKSVVRVLQNALLEYVVPLYVRAPKTVNPNTGLCTLPSILLVEQAKKQQIKLPESLDMSNISDVLDTLSSCGKCPIFMLDGADTVFPRKDVNENTRMHYEQYNTQLYDIADNYGSLGVITGSAKRVRSLAYCQQDDPSIAQYHTFRSLNCTKYQEVAIRPMHHGEIASFMKHLDPYRKIDNKEATKAFAHIGGVQGHYSEWLSQGEFPVPDPLPSPFKEASRCSWRVHAHMTKLNAKLLSQATEGSFEWATKITGIKERGLEELLKSFEEEDDDDTTTTTVRHLRACAEKIRLVDEGFLTQYGDDFFPTFPIILLRLYNDSLVSNFGLSVYQAQCLYYINPIGSSLNHLSIGPDNFDLANRRRAIGTTTLK